MSCHNIGHGLNSVSSLVMQLYDEGKISESAARAILVKIRTAVYYCDGNEGEAYECLTDENRCGFCLRAIPSGQELNCYDLGYDMDKYNLASYCICPNCLSRMK